MSDIENNPNPPDGIEPVEDETRSSGEFEGSSHRSIQPDENYRHTRTSVAWAAVTVAVVFAIALVDFIAQNTRNVRIEFFAFDGRVPIAVALLAAALAGAVVVLGVGIGRVAQLRLQARRHRRWAKTARKVRRDEDGDSSTNGP